MRATNDQLTLRAAQAEVIVDVGAGGRLASLSIDGTEVLWAGPDGLGNDDPLAWGCYPMIPFAGRIRNGKFTFDGTDYALPQTMGPHAMHGYGYISEWTRVDDTTIEWDFTEPWPFAGRATQSFALTANSLTLTMRIEATDRQPILVGWHPWFVRENAAGTLEVELPAESMYLRDGEGMPGELISVPPGPWDDCFTNLSGPPRLRWGDLELSLGSDFDHWVVFDERTHALCVEPQGGPPNEINSAPNVLDAGEELAATFTLEW